MCFKSYCMPTILGKFYLSAAKACQFDVFDAEVPAPFRVNLLHVSRRDIIFWIFCIWTSWKIRPETRK